MEKFFIVGGYSCKNPGDEAILKSTIYRIQELFSDPFFYIWTDQKDFAVNFDRPVAYQTVYWNIFSVRRFPSAAKFFRRLYGKSCFILKHFIRPNREFREAVAQSGKVICIGGGYLGSYYSLADIHLIAHVAKKYRKPLVLTGQTLGPFVRRNHAAMADEIFQYAQNIVIRDSDSLKEVLKHRKKVTLSADDAISFSPAESGEGHFDGYALAGGEKALNVGLNLRIWGNSREQYPQLAQALTRIAYSLPDYKVRFIFIPMEVSEHCDDRIEGQELAKLLKPEVDFVTVAKELSVEQTHRLIAGLDFFIGMRLHSLVFALSNAVPSIGIYHDEYYKRKITGLFEGFNAPEMTLPLERVSRLDGNFGRLFYNREVVKQELLKRKKEIALEQTRIFEEVLRNHSLQSTLNLV